MHIDNRILKLARLEVARREFFYYANIMASDFYREDRTYLVEVCNALQDFVETDEYNVLIMNMPP